MARGEEGLIVLGQAVRQVREQQGVSTAELAAAAGIERWRLGALEAGHLDPRYDLLVALSKGLGVRPSAFVIHAEGQDPHAAGSGDPTRITRPAKNIAVGRTLGRAGVWRRLWK